jgi:hypothetical protein
MDNLNDIKTIWHSAKVDGLPTSDEIRGIIRQYHRQRLIRKGGSIVAAVILLGVMIGVVLFYPSVLLVTRLGEGCIFIAIAIIVTANAGSLVRAYGFKNLNNKAFLQYLERAQQGHIRFYKRTQVIALVFNSVGLLLYLFELVYKSLIAFVIAYGLTVLYLLLMWLVVRPWFFQRKKRKFDKLREKVEKIIKQL